MRIRTVLAAAVLAAVAALPLAGVASAQPTAGDRDCRDFAGQAAAQTALDSTSGDPQRLDANDDGVACEDYFGMPIGALTPPPSPVEPASPVVGDEPDPATAAPVEIVPEPQILVKPQGAPDTGDGSAALDATPLTTIPVDAAPHAAPLDAAPPGLLAAGLGAAAALGAAYLVVRRAPKACPADRRRGRRRFAAGVSSRTHPRSR